MSFLVFLRGLVGVLLVVAIATYAITQSLWTTFVYTLICAALIQVGYFAAILFLVWRPADKPGHGQSAAPDGELHKAPNGDPQPGKVGAPARRT